MGKQKSLLDWDRHVARWRKSGLSQVAYCRRHGLSEHGFSFWKRKLLKQPSGPSRCKPSSKRSSRTSSFIPVRLSPSAEASDWQYEVSLAGGVTVRVRGKLSPAELRALVSEVSRCG